MAASLGAFVAFQSAAAMAAEISPEAVVVERPEIEKIECRQIGKNYVYVDVTTVNADNDSPVMVYFIDESGDMKTIGYYMIASNQTTVTLGVPDDVSTGTYEAVVALGNAGLMKKASVNYVGTTDVDGFFKVLNCEEGADAEAVAKELAEYYPAMSVVKYSDNETALGGSDYEKLSAAQKAEFASLIANKVNGSIDSAETYNETNSERYLKEAYLLALYNAEGSTDKELADAVYKFGVVDSAVEDKSMLVKIAKNMAPTVKHMSDEENPENGLSQVLRSATAVELVNEGFWANLVTIVSKNNDIFGVSEAEIEELLDSKKLRSDFCEKLQGQYMSVEDVKDAWDEAYKYAQKKNSSSSSSGGPSGPSSDKEDKTTDKKTTGIPIANNTDILGVKPVITDYYTDIDKDYYWCADAVLNLTVNNIVSGYGDKTFGPSKNLTRAEFMKMLVNVCGLADVTATSSFTDVKKDEWYYVYVASAEKLGLAQGYGNGLFGVNDPITREDAVTLAYRAATLKGIDIRIFNVGMIPSVDANEISPYAVEAMKALYNAGVFLDSKDVMSLKYVEPKAYASRAYVSVILNELYRLKK